MLAFVFALAVPLAMGCGASSNAAGKGGGQTVELLNVSYDPTRELWRDINAQFIEQYRKDKGIEVSIKQSHGASGSQARAVIDGLEADVVTLALWPDTEAIHKAKLLDDGWEDRFPNRSLPYISTIVFVVRKGNPKGIKDWPDLIKPDVQVITPNPKTSGNGKLSFLAAWGDVIARGGSEDDAQRFVTELYRHTPVLDTGARGSTTTFAQKKIGDVHLTWENEAHLEVTEASGELEIVYPPRSIRAEPHVSVVDANAIRKGSQEVARAYLEFLYTDAGQETIAKHFYRPAANPAILQKHESRFPKLELFPITAVAANWTEAQSRFFAEKGLFDQIYQPAK